MAIYCLPYRLFRGGFPWFLAEAEGILRLHFLDIFGCWGATELAVVDFLEWVDIGAHGFFVHHEWQALVPPAVEGLAERGDDVWVLGCDIFLLSVIVGDIEQLPSGLGSPFFAHQGPFGVSYGGGLKLVLVGVCEFWPPTDVSEKFAVFPRGRRILEELHEASTFDLGFCFFRKCCSGDLREGGEEVEVRGKGGAIGRCDGAGPAPERVCSGAADPCGSF